ncbi:hypothetical protein QLQ15_08130 [Lysobacter sp. LF1]|uniref:Uncharacterized protein n=1 Tax=Lysobacter stagni TaxID=3045172 RepID=A0ABT6XG62_9GAMM|nr:hypothetical protein [Lysobacter sp. LF1]MDI9238880.1 hypothetical protein [Lysobacter sp. LF1]
MRAVIAMNGLASASDTSEFDQICINEIDDEQQHCRAASAKEKGRPKAAFLLIADSLTS